MKLSLVAGLVGCLVLSACNENAKMVLDVEVRDSKSVFVKKNPNFEAYTQTESYATKRSRTRGEGLLEGKVDDDKTETTNSLNKGERGYMVLSQLEDGRVGVTIDAEVTEKLDGSDITFSTRYTVPAEIKSGTWNDYISGKDITLVISEETRQTEREPIEKMMKRGFKKVQKYMDVELKKVGGSAGEITITKFEVKGTTVITANLNRIEAVSDGHVKVSAEIPLSLPN